jgi:lipoprotein NlpI
LVLAYLGRATAFNSKSDHDRAIADFDKTIALDPTLVLAYIGRATAFKSKGDHDRAIADFDKAIALDPNDADARFNRGLAYFDSGDFARAKTDFRRAIELEDHPYAMLFYYLAASRTGQAGGGELDADLARLKSRDWPYPIVELFSGKRTPEATLKAATNAGQTCEARFYVGEWRLIKGDLREAKSLLKSAVAGCPKGFVEHDSAVSELKRLKP